MNKKMDHFVYHIMYSLSKVFLRAGIEFKTILPLFRAAFIQAARDLDTKQNGVEPQPSRLMALTGIARTELNKYKGFDIADTNLKTTPSVYGLVLAHWHDEHPDIISLDTFKKVVDEVGRGAYFSHLLNALLDAKCVREIDTEKFQLLNKYYIPYGDDAGKLEQLHEILLQVMTTAEHNLSIKAENSWQKNFQMPARITIPKTHSLYAHKFATEMLEFLNESAMEFWKETNKILNEKTAAWWDKNQHAPTIDSPHDEETEISLNISVCKIERSMLAKDNTPSI